MCLCLTAKVAFMCMYTSPLRTWGTHASHAAHEKHEKKHLKLKSNIIIINYVFRWATKKWIDTLRERRWRPFHIDFSKRWISAGRLTSSNFVIALDLCHFFSVNDVISRRWHSCRYRFGSLLSGSSTSTVSLSNRDEKLSSRVNFERHKTFTTTGWEEEPSFSIHFCSVLSNRNE